MQSKAEALHSRKLSDLWPQTPSSQPSGDENKRKKHCRSRCRTPALKKNFLENGQEFQNWFSSTVSSQNINVFSPGHQCLFFNLSGRPSPGGIPLQPQLSVTEPVLLILKKVKRHYFQAVDYRTWQLAISSTRYDNTVSSYITKMMKKVKLQLKAHLASPSDSILIIGFIAPFILTCDTNRIHEGATT